MAVVVLGLGFVAVLVGGFGVPTLLAFAIIAVPVAWAIHEVNKRDWSDGPPSGFNATAFCGPISAEP